MRKKIGERIWNISCPECSEYMSLSRWPCLCGRKYRDRHILEGCPEDGVRYGSGEESEMRTLICPDCEFDFDLYDYTYPFSKWSILEKGEDTDSEYIPIKRETWMHAFGTTLSLGGGLIALYLIIKDLTHLSDPSFSLRVGFAVAIVIIIGWAFLLLEPKIYPSKRFIKNPKHKGETG